LIGRGIIKTDDHIRFGRFVDELSEFCYTVMYVPKRDSLIVCLRKEQLSEIESRFKDKIVKVKVPKKGALAFAELRWRS
jgi:hypothetical protein